MTAIGSKLPFYPHSYEFSVEETSAILISRSIEVLREIASDNIRRMKGYKANVQLLDRGIFYPNDYYTALKETHQQKRLDFFLQKGSFWHCYTPTSHFEMVPTPIDECYPTGFLKCCFVLKKGAQPTEALVSLREKISLLGCGETCQISYYEAIRKVLGDDKFNKLFAADSPTPLKIGQSRLLNNPIASLMMACPTKSKIVKGQINQITNTPLYKNKHIHGHGSTFITLCCDDTPGKELFTTLGLSPEGLTYAQVNEALMAEFNKDSIGTATVTDVVAKCILEGEPEEMLEQASELKNKKISSLAEFTELNGGGIILQGELVAKRITLLANSTFEEARLLLDTWVKEFVAH